MDLEADMLWELFFVFAEEFRKKRTPSLMTIANMIIAELKSRAARREQRGN